MTPIASYTDAILAALLEQIRADRAIEDRAIVRVTDIIGRYQRARADLLAELGPILSQPASQPAAVPLTSQAAPQPPPQPAIQRSPPLPTSRPATPAERLAEAEAREWQRFQEAKAATRAVEASPS